MKLKSLLAFLLTIFALILIFSTIVWVSLRYIRFSKKDYCTHFSVDLKPEESEVILEVGKGKLVKVNIKNMGFEDEFKIKTEGPDWVVVKPEKIRLESGESNDIFIYLSPGFGTEGKYDVVISASSYCGFEEETIEVKV